MADKRQEDEDDLAKRFPSVPTAPEIPDVPKVTAQLPPHPLRDAPGKVQPGSMGKGMIATQAAGALTTPVFVLAIGGYALDKKFGTNWIAFIGVVLGFIVGVMGLMRILKKLEE